MGTYLAFTLYSGIFLLAFNLAYRIFAAQEKEFRRNRIILISIYIVSLASWPISRMDLAHLPSDTKGIKTAMTVEVDSTTGTSDSIYKVSSVLAEIYLAGMFATLSLTALSVLKIRRLIKRGFHVPKGTYTIVVIPNEMIAPFSFFKYIVVGSSELSDNRKFVIDHELAHIRGRHSLDLLLAQAICIAFWYNPAAWGMKSELTRVHEYLADDDVIASGADPIKYQMLLIGEITDRTYHILANNLRHSDIKARIKMMQKKRANGIRRLIPIILLAAPIAAYATLSTSILSEEVSRLQSYRFHRDSVTSVEDNLSDITYLDAEGKPFTTVATVTSAEANSPEDEEPITLPLNSEQMNGLVFFVNGKLLSKDEEPIIYVDGKKWTGTNEEIASRGIESFSFRKDSKGRPYGIVDITIKK